MPLLRSFDCYTMTATSDAIFRLNNGLDKWFVFCDIFVDISPACLGPNDLAAQIVRIYPGSSYSIPCPVNLADLFFHNTNTGENTTITIIGCPLTQAKADEWGLGIKIT